MSDDATSGDTYSRRFVLNQWDDAQRVQSDVLCAAEHLGYPSASVFAIRLALEEALSNAFRHGNKNDPSKSVTVQVRMDAEALRVEIADEGDGFDPEAVPDPTVSENLEIPSGRGIVLMRSFMTEVVFEPPGNRVRMVYVRPRDAAA